MRRNGLFKCSSCGLEDNADRKVEMDVTLPKTEALNNTVNDLRSSGF